MLEIDITPRHCLELGCISWSETDAGRYVYLVVNTCSVSPTGRGVVLLSLISRISRMLKAEQSVSLYVESKDDKR